MKLNILFAQLDIFSELCMAERCKSDVITNKQTVKFAWNLEDYRKQLPNKKFPHRETAFGHKNVTSHKINLIRKNQLDLTLLVNKMTAKYPVTHEQLSRQHILLIWSVHKWRHFDNTKTELALHC